MIDLGVAKTCSRSDVFLDNSTGDYYMYKKEMGLWNPIGNVGLHYAKAAEESKSEGAFIRKIKTYKPKPSKYSTLEIIKSKITERKCTIMKEHLFHWAFIGMDKDFVATNESLWDPHPIGMSTTSAYEVNYTIIAESENGPEVIEHRNTIATQFHIEKKYVATVQLLNNFINRKFELIIENSRADMTLEDAEVFKRSMMYTKSSQPAYKKSSDEIKTRSKALFIKKNSLGMETNSVRKDSIRPNTARSGYSTLTAKHSEHTRVSSRLSQQRATTAIGIHRNTHQPRLFSADGTFRTFANQSTAATDSKSNLRIQKQQHMISSTQIIRPEDEEKLSKINKKLIKKFNEFLTQNTKRHGIQTQKLAKTMRSYVETEIGKLSIT
jgi:hypothetical protein